MAGALGINIRLLYTLVFGLGTLLAGLAGVMAGPIFAVESGMGESILILTFVVIVIGGIGSIKGALVGALLVFLVFARRDRGGILGAGAVALVVALSLVRELGPVLTALMVGGRVGSGITAEIGSMAVTPRWRR